MLWELTPDPSHTTQPWREPSFLLFLLAGNLRGYSMATPTLTAPSLTTPQLAPPNLQQFFPQATRQSLLGPPPVGVPINPSQLNLSGRMPQKQSRAPSFTAPNRKVSAGWDGGGEGLPGLLGGHTPSWCLGVFLCEMVKGVALA